MKQQAGNSSTEAAALRRNAESLAALRPSSKTISELDARRLLHELQVHQIELEMQIAELRQANQELENHRVHLRTLINTLPDFIWLKDDQGRYLACNHRFETYIRRTGVMKPQRLCSR